MRMLYKTSCVVVLSTCLITAAAAEGEDVDWTDRLSFKGDFRLRYEAIDRESREKRTRYRYRARLAMTAAVTDDVKVVMQIASGADSPVSRNVTFDGGFTTKDIGFDLAYVDWAAADGLHVFGGKMKNPMFRAGGAPLVYDSDLNPEGFAVTYNKGAFFGALGGFAVEERSQESSSNLYAVQAGGRFSIGESSTLTAGAGYFGYTNTIGNEPFYNGAPKGNTMGYDQADVLQENPFYLYEYKNTEVFAQFDARVGSWPLRVFGHWTRNGEVDEQDTGVAYGVKFGSAKDKGEMEFSWTYQDIDADAVIGTFNDSDFGGGGTDADGHIIKAKYVVAKNIAIAGTYFSNTINRFSLPEEDYDRLQLDVAFSFK